MTRYIFIGMTNLTFARLIFPCRLYFFITDKAFIIDWKLFSVAGRSVFASLTVDGLSLLFRFTVLFIAANIYAFAVGYIRSDPFPHRFSQILLLFVLSINLLIFSPNLVRLLLGWDGLGLTSFLLVVYYQRSYAAGAGLATALTNRLGDVAIILRIAILAHKGTWHIFDLNCSWLCVRLLTIAAITKSAQFPFCRWLPLAIAAPTPVSALVHSSTLVTAGIFLLIRLHPVYASNQSAHNTLLFTGILTITLAGCAAYTEFDFKKVVAYSTLSQLGVITVSLGLALPNLAFFHLLTHAIFKALLFVCVGTIIHSHGHTQDLRRIGNLRKRRPAVQTRITLANLSLCGLPFLRGFYSKDSILEYGLILSIGWVTLLLLVIGTTLTTAYSLRTIKLGQIGNNMQPPLFRRQQTADHYTLSITILTIISVIWGALLNWLLTPTTCSCGTSELIGWLPLIIILSGIAVTNCHDNCLVYAIRERKWLIDIQTGRKTALFFIEDRFVTLWFLRNISTQYTIRKPLTLGAQFLAAIDQGWNETIVRQGAHNTGRILLTRIRLTHRGAPTTVLLLRAAIILPILIIII